MNCILSAPLNFWRLLSFLVFFTASVSGDQLLSARGLESRDLLKLRAFYTGVPLGKAAREIAWIYGLQQNLENRSNLAIVNTGETDSSTDSFQIDIYSGESGKRVQTIGGINVGARRFSQISMILDRFAPGVRQGYVRIRKISGNNPFVAYGVINDGGEPGARTGDGTYVGMSVER